jgi:hypothetical protein
MERLALLAKMAQLVCKGHQERMGKVALLVLQGSPFLALRALQVHLARQARRGWILSFPISKVA